MQLIQSIDQKIYCMDGMKAAMSFLSSWMNQGDEIP